MLIRSGEALAIGWSRNMLYSGFDILPRSVFWLAYFNGRSDNTDVIRLKPMHDRYRFSLRGLLILTTGVAAAISIALAWPIYGYSIGPVWLVASFLASAILFFARRTNWGKPLFRIGMTLLLAVTLLYASFGPASGAMARFNTPGSKYPAANNAYRYVYTPVAANFHFSPTPIRSFSLRYTAWWMPPGATIMDFEDGFGWNVPGWSYTVVSY